MAGKGPPSEAAMKEMVVTHMNNDHIDSVQRYVENYSHVGRLESRTARLTDISTSQMTITAAGKTYHVPFNPPMKSLTEARSRVVQMDAESIKALGRSPITVKESPKASIVTVLFVGLTMSAFLLVRSEHYVYPGSWFHDYYLRFIPGLPSFFQNYRLWLGYSVIGAHAVEAFIMSGKMKKHSVPVLSKPWTLWIASAFWVGFPTFGSLDSVVEKQRIAKEKAKH